ncbi:MAG: Outer rane autotransporter barrel [Devosia sp.]|nr:Outer rane autotransporter barrel [Devosia sp.]
MGRTTTPIERQASASFGKLRFTALAAIIVGPVALLTAADAEAQDLGTFGVLAGSTVTNTGSTTINGNVGVSPGTAITGFLPGIVTAPYTIYQNEGVALRAQSDLTTAYNILAGRSFTTDLTGQDLGGQTLVSGVYNFNSSAQLTGNVTLDGQGDPEAVFIFNIGSTLTTASASSVLLINGARAGNVYFRVGSSATLGAATEFQGKILALTSITLVTGTTINCGAALARNGAVTLDTNVVGICPVAAGTIGDVLDDEDTPDNALELGGAIDDIVNGGGTLPLGFEVLPLLTARELADALNQISGELATGVAPVGTQAMNSFMSLVIDDRRGLGVINMPLEQSPNTVSVLGYSAAPAPAGGEAFAEIDRAATKMPDIGSWQIWSAGFGNQHDVGGGGANGTSDRWSRDMGLAIGLEHQSTADTLFGVAAAIGGTNFGLSNDLGSGRSALFQGAVYGRSELDNAYVAGALGYGFHDVSTSRYVTFAGIDHLTAEFSAHNVAGHIETGYKLGVFTPYASLRGQAFRTPSYGESTEAGNSTFALDYEAQTTLSARTEIGARIDTTTELNNGTLGLHAGAAWAHTYWPETSLNAAFQALPGSTFTVEGTPPASDSLLLSAGAEFTLDTGLSLAGSLEGEFGRNAQSYGGNLKFSYSW